MAEVDDRFDVVILGGGSAGYACALRSSQLGLKVALVERDKLGGTCLHRGCIPTKALLHAGEVADTVRDSVRFGVHSHLDKVVLSEVNTYKNAVVARLYKGLQGLIAAGNITVVEGEGRLVGPDTVEVDGKALVGTHLVLATGSATKTLPGVALDGDAVLGSWDALQLEQVPGHAIVLGGGVIGVEFASAWRSLGADVTIVEALPRLLAAEDVDCSAAVERRFRKRGISCHTGTSVSGVERTSEGVRVTAVSGEVWEGDVVLVAVGRGPLSADLGLDEQGITLDRDWVVTDGRLRTSIDTVYAIGDLVRGVQLAHRGFQHGIFVAEDIAGLDPAPIDEAGIPRVTYCEPEVASVGLREDEARATYGDGEVETYRYDLAGNGKSQILKTQGFVKLVRRKAGPVVGIHMVGSRVSELIGEAQLIYNWDGFPEDVAAHVHMHPTQTEAIGEAHLALAGKPLHAHS